MTFFFFFFPTQFQQLLLKVSEMEQKRQYHSGVSLQSLQMHVEQKPEHGAMAV